MEKQQLSTAVRSKSYSGFVSNPPTMAIEQSVWAKVAALEMSIAAVEQEQERVEAAMRSRASVFALPNRLRYFVVGTVDDPNQEDEKELNLRENLRWLRTKEVQLRNEKLLLIQHGICGSGRNLPQPRERQLSDEVDGSLQEVSYLSSRRMWSAAGSTDSPLGTPPFPRKETASDNQVNGESSVQASRGRTTLKPGRSVRSASAGPKRFVGIFFNGFRRSGASSKKILQTKNASSARFNAAMKSDEAEESSSLGSSKPGGRIDFDFRNPFWQRSFSAARGEEGGGRPWYVRPKRNAPDAPDLGGKQLAPLTDNLSWRCVFGIEDKDPKESTGSASTLTSPKTCFSRQVLDVLESSDDDTTENSSSSDHNKPPPPKAPVMMRGNRQRMAYESVTTASERRPYCKAALSGGSTSASIPASGGCATKGTDLHHSRSPVGLPNRKVRFEVPLSDSSDSSDPRSPLVSPRAKPETRDVAKRSAAAIVEAQRGLSGESVKNPETASQTSQELPRPASEEALSPSLAKFAGATEPMLALHVSQKLPRPANEEALPPSLANPAEAYLVKGNQETGAGHRKLHRRHSSDDGSLIARMAIKNQTGTLLLAERGSIQCAEDAATVEMQMDVMWTTGAYSPTKFASVGAPCRTNNLISSQRSILSSSGGNVLGPLSRSLRHTPRAIVNRRLADKIDGAAALALTSLPPADNDIGRDTLKKIYRFLESTLALTNGQDKQRGCQLAAEALEKLPATVASGTPPSVWVARYVDKSMKYGLGFLLSDGSVGVRFNDATKIVLEAKGGAFEYVDRERNKPLAQIGTEEEVVEETVGLLHPWRVPRPRQGLRDHAPGLEKKVRLLKYFHKDLRRLGGDSYDDSEGKEEEILGEPPTSAGESSGPTEPLTVVEKWRRTRHSCLFLLSTLTVQVVFADTTQILFSEEGRVVTFVDAARKRHTLTLCSLFQEQRMDIIKRVRSSNDLILQLLTRDERVKTSSIEAGTAFANEGPKANDENNGE